MEPCKSIRLHLLTDVTAAYRCVCNAVNLKMVQIHSCWGNTAALRRKQARNAFAISQALIKVVLTSCIAFSSRLCMDVYSAVYVRLCIQSSDSPLLRHNQAIILCLATHYMKGSYTSVSPCLHGCTGKLLAGEPHARVQEARAQERNSCA